MDFSILTVKAEVTGQKLDSNVTDGQVKRTHHWLRDRNPLTLLGSVFLSDRRKYLPNARETEIDSYILIQ